MASSRQVEYVTLRKVAAPSGIAGGPFGSSLGGKDYVADGVPVIRGQNLATFGYFDSKEFVFVSEEKADRELARNIALPGDIVFTQRGTLGQVGLVPAGPYPRYVISQSQMRLRVDPQKVRAKYVYYCFRDPGMLRAIYARAITTGVPHINLEILAELPVPIRPKPEQVAIADILGVLDDKITVNERIAATADELRSTWFQRYLYEEQARVEHRPLSSLASFVNGRPFTKGASGAGRMVIRIAEINSGPGGSTVYSDVDIADQHVARPGDVLFAWSGSLTLARWFRPDAIINQHIFKVLPHVGMPSWLAYELISGQLPWFRSIAAGKATTMGHIQRQHLDADVPIPSDSDWSRLDSELGPLWSRALCAEQESLTLTELRDTLLPKLISGELRIKDAEKTVEDAV